jgi:hypothetical protein
VCEQGSGEEGWLMWQQRRMVWKGLVGIAGKLDKKYIKKCLKYMYGNKMNKIWDSYLPCIAMAHSPSMILFHIYQQQL